MGRIGELANLQAALKRIQQFQVSRIYDDGFRLEATGDFLGRGIWTCAQEQDGPTPRVLIRYDWKILAEKPLLRDFSFIMKPIFGANHRWAMARGEESLKLELARRALVPAPLPATRAPMGAIVVGLLATAAVVWMVTRRQR